MCVCVWMECVWGGREGDARARPIAPHPTLFFSSLLPNPGRSDATLTLPFLPGSPLQPSSSRKRAISLLLLGAAAVSAASSVRAARRATAAAAGRAALSRASLAEFYPPPGRRAPPPPWARAGAASPTWGHC